MKLTQKQQAKKKLKKQVKADYLSGIKDGSARTVIADEVAEKHGITRNTVYVYLRG